MLTPILIAHCDPTVKQWHWCSLTRELHSWYGKGYVPPVLKKYLARFNAAIRHSGGVNENTVNKRLTTALYHELIPLMGSGFSEIELDYTSAKTINPPEIVSVLYIQVPTDLQGGELVLKNQKKQVGQIKPQSNKLVYFQGDLTHSVNLVKTTGTRLSLVCEQYILTQAELQDIPEFRIESRVSRKAKPDRKIEQSRRF